MKTLGSPNPLLYRLLKGEGFIHQLLLKGRIRMTLVPAQRLDLYMGGTCLWVWEP